MTESEREGTFLVTAADDQSAVLKDVHSGQVHTLSSNPGVSEDEAVRGTVAPDPPMNVSWQLVDVETRWTVSVERSSESPTANSKDIASDNPDGELVKQERAGTGEIHVLSVPDDMTDQAVDDILDDREGLLSRAARLDVNRVEVRSAPGVVAVRYMP
ncbi:DUF5812 family protein [Haloferax larsenii]|uniref:Uncharacterized protein n=1 Tax=Haloferax larsenii TaxID=302484 RepID=A0A1H7MNJ0_HALLR|nr:DUF5812 family protein [Haloferax larsenii]ELZ79552.1 hypothetical protein C455_08207 [Haloferax larsenii JCM 13917]UVE50808.1 hypothetical protein KU306_02655 [Haloferax larsenii]SEL12438.1 hypothetical protein SAMN04488691_10327 [Haloferax larsenii]